MSNDQVSGCVPLVYSPSNSSDAYEIMKIVSKISGLSIAPVQGDETDQYDIVALENEDAVSRFSADRIFKVQAGNRTE